jgi:hypothetical protein
MTVCFMDHLRPGGQVKDAAVRVPSDKFIPLRRFGGMKNIQDSELKRSLSGRVKPTRTRLVLNYCRSALLVVGWTVVGWANGKSSGEHSAGHSFADGKRDHADLFLG